MTSNGNIQVLKTFDSDIFSGASIETDVYNLDSLLAFTDVSGVWLNHRVELSPVAPQGFSDDAAASKYSTHNATGVSKLHDAGIFGKGVIVGVVDTGTWYDHPAVRYSKSGQHNYFTNEGSSVVALARVSRLQRDTIL